MSQKYFGTDGIRGKVGEFPMTPDFVMKLGWAAGVVLAADGTKEVLVGKDTRASGYMLESALEAGLSAAGVNIALAGPIPTPAVAYLASTFRADAGVVISASHNPYYDNGIKFFGRSGSKLGSEQQQAIEEKLQYALENGIECVESGRLGKARRVEDASGRYIEFCKGTLPSDLSLEGLSIVVDSANGAAYKVAPSVFEELGAKVINIANTPNGVNINKGCGSLYPEVMAQKVREGHADIGLALDGDADRLVVVDEKGEVVDGDKLIGALCKYLNERKLLQGNACVATVMSNKALEDYLAKDKIELYRSDVGDKYVLEVMQAKGINFGGEQSGHIIFSDVAKTGDGLASALQVLALVLKSGKKASEVLNPFSLYPQILHNMKVTEKIPLDKLEGLEAILKPIREKGIRDLIRYSGTENKIRLLLEGKKKKDVEESMETLIAFFKKAL